MFRYQFLFSLYFITVSAFTTPLLHATSYSDQVTQQINLIKNYDLRPHNLNEFKTLLKKTINFVEKNQSHESSKDINKNLLISLKKFFRLTQKTTTKNFTHLENAHDAFIKANGGPEKSLWAYAADFFTSPWAFSLYGLMAITGLTFLTYKFYSLTTQVKDLASDNEKLKEELKTSQENTSQAEKERNFFFRWVQRKMAEEKKQASVDHINYCTDLNYFWANRYHDDFRVQNKASAFPCPGQNEVAIADKYDTFKVVQAIHEVWSTSFKKNNRGFAPEFYKKITKNIGSLNYSHDYYKPQDKNTVATTVPGKKFLITFKKGNITLYKPFYKRPSSKTKKLFDVPLEDRMSTLVHEGNHLDSDNSGHVICNKGIYKGKDACDKKFDPMNEKAGAYNAEFYLFSWLYSSTHNKRLDKILVGSYMASYILNRFNERITKQDVEEWMPSK